MEWKHDAHEPMSDVDFALLEWVLTRVDPEVVTVEYFRDREDLKIQLEKIRTILSIHSAS